MIRENDNILRLKDVQKRCPLHRSTIYRKMEKGTFPQSVPLSSDDTGKTTAVGWYETDIEKYLTAGGRWDGATR